MIIVETLFPALVGLIWLCFLGYAPTRGLLPATLGPLRWVVLPWTGYAVFVVLAQFATQAGLDMTVTAGLALALAAGANGLTLWRHPLRRPDFARRPPPGACYALLGLTAAVGLLGILPIWFYGYHTIIGENWDGEIYLALGEYLRTYAQPALAQAPANPLLQTLLVPPYSVRTHGFSYVQAAVSALSGLSSLVTLAPTLALLRALAVPATYFFFRTAWRWPARPALWATAILAANPFLLWITYNTFGMQVPSLGLLPLCVAAALLALRAAADPAGADRHRLVGYAALVTAALAVTYHPALTAWAAVSGLGGLAVLLGSGRQWLRVGLAGLGLVLCTVLLSGIAQWLGLQGFLRQYAEQTAGLGLTTFTAPTDAWGLSLSFRSLAAAGPGQALLARLVQAYALLVLLGGLMAAGLAVLWAGQLVRRRTADSLVPLATLGGGVLYLLLFLWPLRYEYGWFKAQSFVAFLLVGATVGGIAGLWPAPGRGRGARRALVPALAAGLPGAALACTLGLLLWQYHWPLRYSREMLDAAQVRGYIRPGESALVSSSRLMPGRLFDGLLAYFLRDSQIYGTFHTANSAWDEARLDGVYTWAVLPARELPDLYGYHTADRVWANDLLALYHAPPDLLYTQTWERKGDYPPEHGRD